MLIQRNDRKTSMYALILIAFANSCIQKMLFSRCFVHTLLLCASFLQLRTPILTAKHQFCIITGDFFSAEAMSNHFLCIFVYKKGKKCALHKERCEKKRFLSLHFLFANMEREMLLNGMLSVCAEWSKTRCKGIFVFTEMLKTRCKGIFAFTERSKTQCKMLSVFSERLKTRCIEHFAVRK